MERKRDIYRERKKREKDGEIQKGAKRKTDRERERWKENR
jgi:hypothetical protein